jgi:hypothetical protein
MLWGQSNFINLHKCFVGGGGGQTQSSSSSYSSSSLSPPPIQPLSSLVQVNNNAIHVVGAMPLIEVRSVLSLGFDDPRRYVDTILLDAGELRELSRAHASGRSGPSHSPSQEYWTRTRAARLSALLAGHTGPTNAGAQQMGLEGISMGISHPHFFAIGDGSDATAATDDQQSPRPAVPPAYQPFGAPPMEEVGSVVKLSWIKALGPGEAVSLPVWIRAATTGQTNFRFLVYYQPQVRRRQSSTLHCCLHACLLHCSCDKCSERRGRANCGLEHRRCRHAGFW